MITLPRKGGNPIAIDPFSVESIEPGCMGGDSSVIKMKTGSVHTIQKQFSDLVHIVCVAQSESDVYN